MIVAKINVKDVLKGLDIMQEDFAKAISDSLAKSALLVEGQSKINSPVDTGRMRSSITTEIQPLKATIMPMVNYAVYVHEGTKFMKARPFMKDALDQKEGAIADIFERELNKAVDKFNK